MEDDVFDIMFSLLSFLITSFWVFIIYLAIRKKRLSTIKKDAQPITDSTLLNLEQERKDLRKAFNFVKILASYLIIPFVILFMGSIGYIISNNINVAIISGLVAGGITAYLITKKFKKVLQEIKE
ncbi:MAG: hypothetical protein ACP5OA_06445 [Candidatus Woesearchaeota archaeon]